MPGMRAVPRAAALFLACVAFAVALASPAHALSRDAGLERRLAAIASDCPGVCGISVLHLDSGRFAAIRADERFPMASTFKLPIAMTVLSGVDQGAIKLDEVVHLNPWDMNPAASALTDAHPVGGVDVTLHDLLDRMLTTSDNTACDVLLRRVGGPAVVTQELRLWSVSELRVDRDERESGNDWVGLSLPFDSTQTAASLKAARDAVPISRRAEADRKFMADPRDTATPRGFTALLAMLWHGAALSPASTDTMRAMLERTTTGAGRLRAGLPKPVKLAHKTGTGWSLGDHTAAVNDVGVITLPGGGGRVAIAVLIRDVRGPVPRAEKTIAEVAKAVFDSWNAPE